MEVYDQYPGFIYYDVMDSIQKCDILVIVFILQSDRNDLLFFFISGKRLFITFPRPSGCNPETTVAIPYEIFPKELLGFLKEQRILITIEGIVSKPIRRCFVETVLVSDGPECPTRFSDMTDQCRITVEVSGKGDLLKSISGEGGM
jgi:hypothetical protein